MITYLLYAKRRSGFTLVEVLASVGILVTFLTAALVSFTATQNLSEGTQQQAGVLQEAKAKLEEIRAHNFHDVLTDYSSGGTPGNTFNIPNLNAMGNIVLTDVYDDDPAVQELWLGEHDDYPVGTGDNWIKKTDTAWGSIGRSYHSAVVFKDKIWVLGGYGGSFLNDVWYSADGASWTQVTPTGSIWSPRWVHSAVVFDNKIWVLGGYGGTNRLNDVWSSPDGITWTQATASAWGATGEREGHSAVVFDNKIWVLGGYSGSAYLNEVWYSADGITWTQATASAWGATGGRGGHSAVGFGGKIWVLGGCSGSAYLNEVWYSADGITWTQSTASAWGATGGRWWHSAVDFGGKIWTLGGRPWGGMVLKDVWWGYGARRMYQVDITISWRQRNGRIVGEDNGGATGPPYPAEALNGILDPAEDDGIGDDGDGKLDSPVHITGLIANRGYPSQIYLGRE